MQLQRPATLDAACLNVMNFLNEVTLWYPSAISFAPGRPAEHYFDVSHQIERLSRFAAYTAKTSGQSSTTAFNRLGQYQKTNGIINDIICRFLEQDEHIRVAPEAVMMTDGCQEAMTILLAGLFDPAKDVLFVIDPTYIGITGIATILGIEICPVPAGSTGFDRDALVERIRQVREQGKNPRAIYVIPDFNNPVGTSMTLDERWQLLDLAGANDMLVFEDSTYGMFAYDTERMPTLKSIDRAGVVVYLGTFSKVLFPGLRVGFLVADQQVIGKRGSTPCYLAEELSKVKSLTTVTTSPLLQGIVGGILLEHHFTLSDVMREKITFYRANRDVMLKSLDRHFNNDLLLAGSVSWNHPGGGFFLTVNLPFAFTEQALRTCAEQYGVICCPMSFFSLLQGNEHKIRLSFSYVSKDEIERGIFQLWKFVHDYEA